MGVLSGMRVLKFEAIGPEPFGTMPLASPQLVMREHERHFRDYSGSRNDRNGGVPLTDRRPEK
jgi:hypothetical protein